MWLVGDVHGDLLGLLAVLRCVSIVDADPVIVFLGDLLDRGEYSNRVLYEALKLVHERPTRSALIVGNHDEGLSFNPSSQTFTSSVCPSDFAHWLNVESRDSTWRELAKAAIGSKSPFITLVIAWTANKSVKLTFG